MMAAVWLLVVLAHALFIDTADATSDESNAGLKKEAVLDVTSNDVSLEGAFELLHALNSVMKLQNKAKNDAMEDHHASGNMSQEDHHASGNMSQEDHHASGNMSQEDHHASGNMSQEDHHASGNMSQEDHHASGNMSQEDHHASEAKVWMSQDNVADVLVKV
ncbi:uncharacterized protein LOC144038794 [Vanacampus margaritifer]